MIVRMLAHAVLAQTGELDAPEDRLAMTKRRRGDDDDRIGDASAVAATSLSEGLCGAARRPLHLPWLAGEARRGTPPAMSIAAPASAHLAITGAPATRLGQAREKRLASVAAAEELAGWVEARLGPETAPIVAGYLRLEHARGQEDVERAQRRARDGRDHGVEHLRQRQQDLRRPCARSLRPRALRSPAALSWPMRRRRSTVSRRRVSSTPAAPRRSTRRLGLLLGICTTMELSDSVRLDAGKALRVCHTADALAAAPR
jgi:hypothetical protein